MDISLTFVWLIIAVVMAVIELFTMGLTTIYFAAGALVAMILAIFDVNIWVQLTAAVLVSGVSLLLVRPMAKRYLNGKTVKTNIDALIGKKIVAKTDIDNKKSKGKVDLDGSTWIALSEDDNIVIPQGHEVEVVKIEGVKVIVREVR